MAATRRLAAVLAADVVGYSRLIGADEQGTLARLKTIRASVVDPTISANNGRIVKTTGDGFLAEFGSTVEALRCAHEIQEGLSACNAGVSAASRLDLRIGIHQGDIAVEDDDIFGDGVNIAARLEALAEPGGICVSARIQEDVTGKLDLSFRDLGEKRLHNIARPVRAYLVGPEASRHSMGDKSAHSTPRISLVVLPFTNVSPDPEQEYFADAVTDDLTTDLSRIAHSFVIARTTAFTYKGKAVDIRKVASELGVRYVLEGSVRRLSERVQVNVQLIDGETGSHIWADRFDVDRRDLARAQSEITGRLARQLDAELIGDVSRRIEQENTANPDARDLVMRARALTIQRFSEQAYRDALSLLELALSLEPRFVDAQIEIARILATEIADGVSKSVQQDKARTEQSIREALERDPNRSSARMIMGLLRRVQGRWAESQAELEAAIALDQNNAFAIRQLGVTVLIEGQAEAAIPYFQKSIRLDPLRPFNAYTNLGRCYLFLGLTNEAVDLCRKARMLNPGLWYVHLDLAGALGLRGEIEEAKREIAEALELKPEVNSIAQWRALAVAQGFGHPNFQALRDKTTYKGLRAAGFPEE